MEKKINKKVWGTIALINNIGVIFMNILIIAKVLPYNIAVGGQLTSYEMAADAACTNIVIPLFLALSIAIASDILIAKKFHKASIWILRFFTVYFCLNILMNLFGATWFEKIGASLSCVIQIICFVHILRIDKKAKANQ